MIKPIDLSNKLVSLKIFFIFFLILTGVLADRVFLNKVSFSPKKQNNKILGESKNLKKEIDSFVETKINQAKDIGQSVLGETTKFLDETKEKVASSVSEIIYDNSFKKIIDQIEKLPQDQKERIKKDLCQ